jgi:hypothetical protein
MFPIAETLKLQYLTCFTSEGRSKTHSKYDKLQHYISKIFCSLKAILRYYIVNIIRN